MDDMHTPATTPDAPPLVLLVDDDVSVRRALARLIHSCGLDVETFTSAEEFLAAPRPRAIACIILDVHLGGMSGPDLYRRLADEGDAPPVIFITAHDTPQVRSQATAFADAAYLRKPFDSTLLLDAVGHAVGRDLQL